jgi:hypothetical protein
VPVATNDLTQLFQEFVRPEKVNENRMLVYLAPFVIPALQGFWSAVGTKFIVQMQKYLCVVPYASAVFMEP